MIVHGFKSVLWVGAVAGAAISCYMVSLRVAAERASLERVETRILIARRDIRSLDTELGTRGRLRQLERWNSDVLALAAPTEAQFLQGEGQLAGLARAESMPAPVRDADVRTASADSGDDDVKAIHADYRLASQVSGPAHLVRASAHVSKPKSTTADTPSVKPRPSVKPQPSVKPKSSVKPKPKTAATDKPAPRKPAATKTAAKPTKAQPGSAARHATSDKDATPDKKAKAKKTS